jgi:dienelactone hydrolase
MKNLLLLTCIISAASTYGQLQKISYSDGSQKLHGYAAKPVTSASSSPGVLVLPAWRGIDNHSKEVATDLSKLGYHAFVADIYGEGNYPAGTKEAGEKSGYYKTNFIEYQRRIQIALQQLLKSGADANNIVVIGYCFGGTGALEAARGGLPVKAAVTFHGGLGKDPKRQNNMISPKILVLHGADDPFVPEADIKSFQQEMRDGKADWQMVYYADAVHSFTEEEAGTDKSKGAAYNEKADQRSWEHMKLFLQEVFAAK